MKTKPTNICPQCSTPLPPDAPAGLCPACVMAMNLATPTLINEDGSAEHIKLKAPELDEIIPLFQQLEIIELLGQGGMGVVYKARQKKLDRFAALKILPKEIGEAAGFSERFAREARALGKLNHPNIVTLYEFGHVDLEDGEPLYYFLMEFVDGLNLRQLLHTGRIEAREALSIVPQICDALQYAHDEGIVHRDIKPENILLDRCGNVKVADFGLAKITDTTEIESDGTAVPSIGDPQSTIGNIIMGTPKYMSPEQIQAPGAVDHRADIYALGVVFYQMLTGEMPEDSLQPPSTKANIDVRLDEVVLRALEEKPDLRYQQASILKTSIETIAAQEIPETTEIPDQVKNIPLPSLILSELFLIGFLLPLLLGFLGISIRLGALEILIVIGLFGFLNYYALKKASRKQQRLIIKTAAWAIVVMWFPLILFTLFFINAMANETGGGHPGQGEAYFVIVSILGSVLLPVCASRLFRALRPPLIPKWVIISTAVTVISIILISLYARKSQRMVSLSNHPTELERLAVSPQKLRKQSATTVIDAGMTDITLPWAWHELQQRAEEGCLNQKAANDLVSSFIAWMKENHPEGYNQPLHSFGDFMKTLSEQNLLSEDDKLLIRIHLTGAPTLEPLPRMIKGEEVMTALVRWSSPWDDDLFGYTLLNDLKSIRINGQPADIKKDQPPYRRVNDYAFTVVLPQLDTGTQRLECEIESALVTKASTAGLDQQATANDWPPAGKRWTRACNGEFNIFEKDAQLVRLVDTPQRAPTDNRGISVKSITINSANNGSAATATVKFKISEQITVPISGDIFLTLENKTYPCGRRVFYPFEDRTHSFGTQNTVSISIPARSINTATVTIRPNPEYLERKPNIDEIWNKELVFRDVKLDRYDLTPNSPVRASEGSFQEQQDITITRGNADANGFIFFSFANRKWVTPDFKIEHDSGNAHFAKLTNQQWDWIRGNKLDVLFHFGDTNYEMLTLETSQYFIAQPMEWNEATPDQVTSLFERLDAKGRVRSLFPTATSGNGYRDGLTSVNAFRTRDNLMGAYQIRRINDDFPSERGVMVRYWLLDEVE